MPSRCGSQAANPPLSNTISPNDSHPPQLKAGDPHPSLRRVFWDAWVKGVVAFLGWGQGQSLPQQGEWSGLTGGEEKW